jgi:hypothetical protein
MLSHGRHNRVSLDPQLLEDYVIMTAIEMKRMKRERQQELSFNLALIAFLFGVLVCFSGFVIGTSIH